ncbi:hypothetical protein [Streptomyces sp. RK76]|uniref:hypothetical protein n=1 Tax=Streptomyces sp. RK76 TaxID=2824896 RepID=UPI001B37E682|nr:hypothetical protein [Streptomyces sp. RK76]MBQ0947671.1 hypothetical protein [Streptomyces sp. RK76]
MTDHFPRASVPASSPREARIAELHRLCNEDYASNAARRAQHHRDDAFLTAGAAEAASVR